MDKYTASNGAQIVLTNAGQTGYVLVERDDDVASAYLGSEEMVAWREFFQAERDEELGRWRFPLDPQVVVYPGYSPGDDQRIARIVHETTGISIVVYESDGKGRSNNPAANAYFDAHPVRKPWEDAKRDEVWLFKSEGNGQALAWRAEDGWDVIDQRGNYHRGIEDIPAEMRAHSFYGWENPTAVRMEGRPDV